MNILAMNMKSIFCFAIMMIISYSSMAQPDVLKKEMEAVAKNLAGNDSTGWKRGGVMSLNITQTSLTNWNSGGQSSISTTGLFNVFANYKNEKLSWDNRLDMAYGIMKQGGAGTQKTDDKVDLSSKLGKPASKNWNYSLLFNFRTQFTRGYQYPNDSLVISNLLAPAYMLLSLGMDYQPNDNISLFLSPLTGRITIVNDDRLSAAGAFGVDPGEIIRAEFGGFISFQYIKKDLVKNVNLETRLQLFSNYLDRPQNIDVNWENMIAMKINKFLVANITTQLIYDNDIDISVDENNDGVVDAFGPRVQFKEVLGIGLSYKF